MDKALYVKTRYRFRMVNYLIAGRGNTDERGIMSENSTSAAFNF